MILALLPLAAYFFEAKKLRKSLDNICNRTEPMPPPSRLPTSPQAKHRTVLYLKVLKLIITSI
ncbi:hypothetical protein BKI52_44815 [marine bacterium AO1-C]|nr:hypothetical protein BKI52_44815 [marine bacterium AO1-C]